MSIRNFRHHSSKYKLSLQEKIREVRFHIVFKHFGIFKQKDEIKILKTQRITFIIPYNKIIFLRDPPFIDNIKA